MTTKAKKQDKAPEVSTKKPSGPGVISTIAEMIEKAKPDTGVTKDQILAVLVKKFPDRDAEGMKKTVAVQCPARISSERFKVKRLETGGYVKA